MGPIVSGYGSLTHTFLDLTDSEKLPSDLKDTDFFNELNQIAYTSTMDSLVTLDVTHISHEAGFYCNDSRVHHDIVHLTTLVLTKNCFVFERDFYLQGTAMGTKL